VDCFVASAPRNDGERARNDKTQVRILAARSARGLPSISAPLKCKGARGMPGARCTRGLVCKHYSKSAHEHTGSPRSPGIPARGSFTAYHVLSSENGLDDSVAGEAASTDLAYASPCRDHTFLPSARSALVSCTSRGHRSPPRVFDVRETPLCLGRDGENIGQILILKNRNIFRKWTGQGKSL
jgi:hypothetical protein